MRKIQALFLLTIGFCLTNCTGSVAPPQNQAAQQLSQKTAADCSSAQCPCTSPAGPVASGATITVYNTSQVQCGQTCDTQATKITCNNGVFSQDITKLNFACSIAPCSACSLGINLINDGGSIVSYNTAQADCGDSCAAHTMTRLCNNGVLSGDASYNQTNCQPATCECQMPDNTGFLTLGGSMPFYSAKQAACGQTCAGISQTRTCTSQGSGSARTFSWSGQSTYMYSTCTNPNASQCQCTLPRGLGALANGQSYSLSSVPTSTCTPCSQQPGESVTCVNGVLKDTTTQAIYNSSTSPYVYQCVNLTCQSCTLPGYGTIPNNSSITLYSAASIACGVNPSTLTFNFACSNTTLTANGQPYTATGTPTWYTAMNPTCTGCTSPWGETYATNTVVTMYKLNTFAAGSCGQSCSSVQKTCQASGVFSGDSSYTLQTCNTSCTQQGGGAPPRTCLLPWQNSFVTPGAQIPMWRKKTTACGDSCQNYFKLGTCQISTGTFDAGFSYIYPACTEICP